MDDTFFIKGVKSGAAFDFVKKLDNFKDWSLGGDVLVTDNWTSKRPFNVNAVNCNMAQKSTKLLGTITVMLEITQELKNKSLSCKYRMVTFSDQETDKKTIINQPTVEFDDEFKFITTKDGTIIHRTCSNYVNHGTIPIFMEQWLMDENRAIVEALAPGSTYEPNATGEDGQPKEEEKGTSSFFSFFS